MRMPRVLSSLAVVALATTSGCPDDPGTEPSSGGSTAGPGTTSGPGEGPGPGSNDATAGDTTSTTAGSDSPDSSGSSSSGTTGPGVDPYSTDYDLFFGEARCDRADFLLCEDFEDPQIDEDRWIFQVGGGSTLDLGSTYAARGSQAVRIQTGTNPGARGYLANEDVLALTGDEFYGRMFFYIEQGAGGRTDGQPTVHWNYFEGAGPLTIDASEYTALVREGGITRYHPDLDDQYYLFNYEMAPHPPGFSEVAQGGPHSPFPEWEGVWFCVEWWYDGPNNEARLWSNAVELPEVHITGVVDDLQIDMPPFDQLRFGWQHYQPINDPYIVWIDEIAIDDERIGCVR